MKRFQFSLEKVLRLRSQETEQAKRALGYSLAMEEEARLAWDSARSRLLARTLEAQEREQRGMTAFDFAATRNYLSLLQQEFSVATAHLAEAEAETAARREALISSRRREQVLEKLRENRLASYDLESLREAQKELDEYGKRRGLNAAALGADV